MTSPFRRAMSLCAGLSACSIAILAFTHHLVVYASRDEARERGAIAFHTKGCEQCHSIAGVGGDRAPDLGSVGQRRGASQIKVQILKGGHGMPPFEGVLTKDEVKDLVTFLTSCRADTTPGCRQWMPPQTPQ